MKRSQSVAAASLPQEGRAAGGSQEEGRPVEEMQFWIDSIGAPVLVLEMHSLKIRHANECAAGFFMKESGSFSGASVGEVVGGDAELMLAQVWNTSPAGKLGEPFLICARSDGRERMLMVRASKVVVDAKPLRLFTFTDAPPEDSVALAGWQANMMEILNWFPVGFEIANNQDQIQFSNAQCLKLFGWRQHEIQEAEDWWRLAYPDPARREYAQWKWDAEISAARAENREMTPFDLDVATAWGDYRTIQFHHRTIGSFNVNLFLDVTRERAYERELRTLAETDPLTGVMNRRRFFEEAARLFEADISLPLALLMLDIDHFKGVNDTHGHISGDAVLQEFTQRSLGVLRAGDLLARLGGEEFAVLLPGATLDDASRVANRLRAVIRDEPFNASGSNLRVTTSIGGTCRSAGDTVDSVITRADKALYEAKGLGRDRVVLVRR